MENIEKKLESILKDVNSIVALGYNSTEKLEKNTVEWAVCHRFYSEGISLEYKVKDLLEELKNSKKDSEKETECECCSNSGKDLLEELKNSKKDSEKETECECCSNSTCVNGKVEDDEDDDDLLF